MQISKSLLVILLIGFSIGLSQQKQKVCHALALSGGANKGAYEAGVIYELVHQLKPEDVQWDVVSGVSAGAINTVGISVWPVGEEIAMTEFLKDILENIETEMIYKWWEGGITEGIFNKSGIFDNTPLKNSLKKILVDMFPNGPQRKMIVSAVDVTTGSYITYTEKDNIETLIDGVLASTSIPFIFPNAHIKNSILMDGGAVWNINLVSAVDRCMELVDDESQIVIDIAICGSAHLKKEIKVGNAIDNYMRFRDISNYYSTLNDVLEFKQTRPNIKYRYFLMPSKPLTSGLQELIFNNATMAPMFATGREDAQIAINMGEGKVFELLESWDSEKELKVKFPIFEDYLYSFINSN